MTKKELAVVVDQIYRDGLQGLWGKGARATENIWAQIKPARRKKKKPAK